MDGDPDLQVLVYAQKTRSGLLSPDRFCKIPIFGGKSRVVRGEFFVQKNTLKYVDYDGE